jgi:hypothetical protein
LHESESFLLRVREELVPGVEAVRDELLRRYPEARQFIESMQVIHLGYD